MILCGIVQQCRGCRECAGPCGVRLRRQDHPTSTSPIACSDATQGWYVSLFVSFVVKTAVLRYLACSESFVCDRRLAITLRCTYGNIGVWRRLSQADGTNVERCGRGCAAIHG